MPAETSTPAACGIAYMAKASKAGRTKTRLTPPLASEQAARLNTAFLQDCADTVIMASGLASIAGYMAFGPPGERGFFDFLPPAIGLVEAWAPPVFGDTLSAAMDAVLARGHAGACLVNADSPTLPPSALVAAAEALAGPDDRLVLGPSTDGGYYLIGMRRNHRRVFEDIAWSTAAVMRQTLERAAEIALPVTVLHDWYDVDDAESFAVLQGELLEGRPFDAARPSAPAPHTRALLVEIARRSGRT